MGLEDISEEDTGDKKLPTTRESLQQINENLGVIGRGLGILSMVGIGLLFGYCTNSCAKAQEPINYSRQITPQYSDRIDNR